MRFRPLRLDFQRRPRIARWTRIALPVIAIAFVVDLVTTYDRLQASAALARSRPRIERTLPPVSADRETLERQTAAARGVIDRLALPWHELFRSLEHASNANVSILSIEPDSANGTITIAGEAKDLAALLTYIAWLGDAKPFARVQLVKHELRRNQSGRPVQFSVTAIWKRG